MDCEMCGKYEAENVIRVEGAKLSACRACSKYGKILFALTEKEDAPVRPSSGSAASEEEVVEDYASRIRSAREKMQLTRLQLGSKVGEQETYLHAMEQGRVMPTLATAKKLEKFLGIRLIEQTVDTGASPPASIRGGGLTLGDMLTPTKKKGR